VVKNDPDRASIVFQLRDLGSYRCLRHPVAYQHPGKKAALWRMRDLRVVISG
jgi:hypothetical protein